MAGREVRVALIGDPSSLQRALRQSQTGLAGFQQRMQAIGSRMRTIGAGMTRSLTLPLVGFGIVAFRELTAGENALAQTQAVIESTGGAARKSVQDIVDLSQSLSDLTSLDDEPIQEAANTLLTFRRIAGRTFDEATEATLDLSVAMHRDLNSSAVLVGKALNDPIRGLSSLSRVGVTFTDSQRQAIEAMVAFGDTAGAQRIILEELNAEFGGSAEAFGETTQGRLNRVKNEFENMAATILEDLLPVLEDLTGAIDRISAGYDQLTPKQQNWVAALIGIAFVAGPVATVLGGVATALGFIGKAIGFLLGPVGLVLIAIGLLAGALYLLVKNWGDVSNAARSALGNITANVPGAEGAVNRLRGAVNLVRSAFSDATNKAGQLLSGLEKLRDASLSGLEAALGRVVGWLVDAVSEASSLLSLLTQSLDKQAVVSTTPKKGESFGGLLPPRAAGGGFGMVVSEERMQRAFERALERSIQQTVVVG